MSIAACMFTCLRDSDCGGVTLQWLDAPLVSCFKRGGITIAHCDVKVGDYSTFTLSTAEPRRNTSLVTPNTRGPEPQPPPRKAL